MSSRRWLEEQAAKARRENPNLISGDELMRRMAAAKQEARDREQEARHRQQELSELTRLRAAAEKAVKLLEEGRSSSS